MYSLGINFSGNGFNVLDDGTSISDYEVVERLNEHEQNRLKLIEGLKLIRYGTLQEKKDWLHNNYPETYEFDTIDPTNTFINSMNISCDMWIASELINILQDEK